MKEPKPQGPDADQEHLDQLLDDLYALQKNLLHDEFNKAQELDLPETDTEADFDSLEIPILTQSLNREIDDEHQSRKAFDEAQHILFENPDDQPAEDPTQINQEQVKRHRQSTDEQNAAQSRTATAGENSRQSNRAI